MKTNKIFGAMLGAALLMPFLADAQVRPSCDFSDDYSSTTGWTQVNSLVSVSGGTVLYNAAPDGSNTSRRIFKSLGTTISSTNSWTTKFEFKATAIGTGGPGHILCAMTAGNLDPVCDQATYAATNQDCIMAAWESNNNTNSPSSLMLYGRAKDGNGAFASSAGILLALNTQYYLRLDRIDATHGQISAYTDAAYSIPVSGSPQCFTISSGVTGLTYIQHGGITWGGSDRSLTATVDNVCLKLGGISPGTISYSGYVCTSGSITINSTGSGGIANFTPTYQWEKQDNCTGAWTAIPGATGLTLSGYSISNSACFRRKIIGPCGVEAYSNTVSVTVYVTPTPSINVSGMGACDNSAVLTASVPPAQATGISYLWNTGATTATITPTISSYTVYTVTASNACYSTNASTGISPCVNLTGDFPPDSNGLTINDDFCVNWDGTHGSEYFWIKDLSMADGAAPAYNATQGRLRIWNSWGMLLYDNTWYAGCGGLWNGIFTWNGIYAGSPVSSGWYEWKLDLSNCGTGVHTYEGSVFCHGVCPARYMNPEQQGSTASGNSMTNVYPNPGNGAFEVTFEMPSDQTAGAEKTVVVTDVLGKEVVTMQVPADQSTAQVNLTDQPAGVYFFTVKTGEKTSTVRVVKQ